VTSTIARIDWLVASGNSAGGFCQQGMKEVARLWAHWQFPRLAPGTRLASADGGAEQVPDAVGEAEAERAADNDPQHRAKDVAAAQAGAEGARQTERH
jgi:predicted  nucleic acid-binding Zn-ribbon protein